MIQDEGGPFLRTTPDGATGNNLDRLPACRDLPRQIVVRVRRNAADLSDEERARFTAAVNELRNRYPTQRNGLPDPVNWWFKQDESHVSGGPHQTLSFFPWHRELLNRFEALSRRSIPSSRSLTGTGPLTRGQPPTAQGGRST